MNNCKICEVECPSTFCGDCSKMIGQGIAALTADRDKWRDRCERLIEATKYIDSYTVGEQIQKEIDDDTTRPSHKMEKAEE